MLRIEIQKRNRSRRLRQLATLALENPFILNSVSAVGELLKVSRKNAKTILYRYRKLAGNTGNRLCPECLAVLKILLDSLACSRCGFEHDLPSIIATVDSTHEKQSGIWPLGTEMTVSELKQVAPNLKKLFSTKEERIKRQLLSDLEENLKSYTLAPEQTTHLAQCALFHFRILVYEKGKMRVFKAVALTLLDGARMTPILSLALRDYLSTGPYYSARKHKKRKANLHEKRKCIC